MSSCSTISELVGRARSGDRHAFDLLVDKSRNRLEALISLRLGPRLRQHVDVDDVYQETLLRAFKSIATFEFRGDASFFRWLGGIAEHTIKSLVRYHLGSKKRLKDREQTLADDLPLADGGTSPGKAMRRSERFERLERALERLSEDHREVILLARLRNLPIKEIARKMGRTEGAVSMLLRRALRQLRVHFGSTDSLHLPARSLDVPFAAASLFSGEGVAESGSMEHDG